jgi:hypothetical protein
MDAIKEELDRTQARYIVIADPEGLRPGEQFVEMEAQSYERDSQVHAKHSHVEVIVYGRIDNLAPRDFALPENGLIHIGTEQDARYILDGWYRREDVGGVAARWTGSAAESTLRVYLPDTVSSLTMYALSFSPGQVVEVLCNNEPVGQISVPQVWAQHSVALPSSCHSAESTTLLRLRTTVLKSPSADGQSTDHRTLGIAVASIQIQP